MEPWIEKLWRKFINVAKKLDPRRLVFMDGAGSHIAMTREYARAPRGKRAHESVPRNAGTVTTMIGALDVKGVRAMMTIGGSRDQPSLTVIARDPRSICGSECTEACREVLRPVRKRQPAAAQLSFFRVSSYTCKARRLLRPQSAQPSR